MLIEHATQLRALRLDTRSETMIFNSYPVNSVCYDTQYYWSAWFQGQWSQGESDIEVDTYVETLVEPVVPVERVVSSDDSTLTLDVSYGTEMKCQI